MVSNIRYAYVREGIPLPGGYLHLSFDPSNVSNTQMVVNYVGIGIVARGERPGPRFPRLLPSPAPYRLASRVRLFSLLGI